MASWPLSDGRTVEKKKGRGSSGARPLSLERRLASLGTDGLLVLATAAGASPLVRHRWPSLAHLFYRTVATGPRSGPPPGQEKLASLLGACVREEPRLAMVEDYVPLDPREVVVVRRGSKVLRLFPGGVERPVADVARWSLVADAVDEVLVPKLGFGVAAYTEVALRYLDHAVTVMEPAWSTEHLPSDGKPAVVSAELSAARELIYTPLPDTVVDSQELQAALEWATAPADALPYWPDHSQSIFGPYLRVALPRTLESPSKQFWLPPAFLPDAISYGVTELASLAASEADVMRRFASLAAARARRALWRFSGLVLGPPDKSTGPDVAAWQRGPVDSHPWSRQSAIGTACRPTRSR